MPESKNNRHLIREYHHRMINTFSWLRSSKCQKLRIYEYFDLCSTLNKYCLENLYNNHRSQEQSLHLLYSKLIQQIEQFLSLWSLLHRNSMLLQK